jgi:hypothetical protein
MNVKKNTRSLVGWLWIVVLVLAFWCPVLYLLLAPVALKLTAEFRPPVLDLLGTKDYYSVISAAVSSFVGATGLVLGGMYYLHRLGIERARIDRDRRRSRLEDLITKLNEVDDDVLHILLRTSDGDVRIHALRILRRLGSVEQSLSFADDLNMILADEIRAVVRLYSYLEVRCNDLLEMPGEPSGSGGTERRRIDLDEYSDRFFDAQRALHTCGNALSDRSS